MGGMMDTQLALLPEYQGTEILKPGTKYKNYYCIDGRKMVRCTNILSQIAKGEGFDDWLIRTGVEKMAQMVYDTTGQVIDSGLDLAEHIHHLMLAAEAAPGEVRDEAAEWGTRAHAEIQQAIFLMLASNAEVPFRAPAKPWWPTLQAFYDFTARANIRWAATELTVWDERIGVAGTVDAVGWYDRECPSSHDIGDACVHCDGDKRVTGWVIEDHKTGKSLYPEAALQLSAYAAMVERLYGIEIDEGYIVRFPRDQPTEGPGFEAQMVPDLGEGWERYQDLVKLKEYSAGIRKAWKKGGRQL